ncbi:MAG: hypothetical protein DSZ31_05405 [Gammaproteobacteria bacterium]|nr:MAG: hypothetical protein DSZ31_05405 [Gammaproteobacteria bacterium]
MPLLFLFFLLSFTAGATEVKYNYIPAKNNLSVLKPKELEFVAKEICGIKAVRCKENICQIELFPLLVDYSLEGFSVFSLPKIEKYLGLKTFYRYSEQRLSSIAENITFFLKNRGYLDASVKSTLFVSKKGFAKLKIHGKEGDLYLWGGFDFEGNKCFSQKNFYRVYQKPFGSPFSYIDLYNALDLAQELCRKKSLYKSFVYYKEPPRVEKKSLIHFAWKNLREGPFLFINFLSSYIDILVENPVAGVKFLFSKQNAVYPKLVIQTEGKALKLEIKGAKRIPKKVLVEKIKKFARSSPFFSTLKLQNFLLELYRSKGFFDIKIEILRKENFLKIKISEGKRYKLEVRINPNLKNLKLPKEKFYSREVEKKLVKLVENYLRKEKYLYEGVKVYREIDKKGRKVVLTIFAINLRKVAIIQTFHIAVKNKNLKEFLEEKLEEVDPYRVVTEKNYRKEVQDSLNNLLVAFGCDSPEVSLKREETEKGIKLVWNISCPSVKRFGKTVFWVEGRIKQRELEYMIKNFEGKRFNRKYLTLLEKRLRETDLFESLSVKTVRGEKIYPLVEGVEKKPLSLEGLVGFSSDEGLMLDTSFKVRDPFGWGSVFTFRYKLSQKRNLYELSYLDNYLFSARFFGGLNLFKRYEEHRDYTITSKGFSVTAGYHLNLYADLALTLVSNHYNLEEEKGKVYKFISSAEVYYPLSFPQRGLFSAFLSLSVATHKGNYTKAVGGLNFALFRPNFYGSLKFSAGVVSPKAPVFEKFYLGGIKNLKGYSYEGVAPAGGGDIFWYLGTEAGFPAVKPLYLFAGFDLGNSVKRGENPFREFKKDIFAGVGGVTTVGPIRFVVALPLEGKITVGNFKYLFLIGFNF